MAKLVDDATSEPDHADAKRIRDLERQLAAAKEQHRRAEARAAGFEKALDLQGEIIERRAAKLFRSPRKVSHAKGGHYHRVLIPDTHGAHIDERASKAFLADLEYLQPKEVVWLGDHLDCGGFLAQHHTLGFVPETAVTFSEDVQCGNEFVDAVQKRTPKAVHHFLTGNHEHRLERWCCQQSLGKQIDAKFFLDRFGVGALLNLDKRGFHYYPRGEIQPGMRTRGAIKLGCCNFVHDVSTARNAAQVAIGKWAANICFGDTHRMDYHISRKADRDIIGVTNGCLSKLQPYWQETNVTEWSQGYAVQIVTNSGEFLHVIVPILEGKSLLGPFLGAVK